MEGAFVVLQRQVEPFLAENRSSGLGSSSHGFIFIVWLHFKDLRRVLFSLAMIKTRQSVLE